MIIALLAEIQDPDDREFAAWIYQEYGRLMQAVICRYVQKPEDQEDILHDVMIRLIKKISVLRTLERCTLASYIVCTVRNSCISYLRRIKRGSRLFEELDANEYEERHMDAPTMDELMVLLERRQLLYEVLNEMDDGARCLLEGKYILGYSDPELAEQLGVKPASIRMILTRARREALARLQARKEAIFYETD